ncbi:c-type cytochrome biogenesis protein CcmI [Pluralibacter gergoviae]|uniref:c-type cytochrome biogenesis protein CcmI n=1 Tax=Pluralibacter gergoviae TaxID=61647 RepID=UPI0005EC2846|nr:c-type cytochrome biogenesis protein CcmI [Pluralibacter gergoviae]EKT9641614.1 c-type cytochrome biogenesis protein CcmI [Pluralibacter gergoviae]EKV3544009.1 c-type cytochrome biogenesis protein CcmI [Pluralibacter gergoviae]EKV9900256.1 c-type cytochrome biogenesis protein CcmI [Pluralibacter gergoviae]EKV9929876.1 c-type cytochrome biogenesis protein CcmI [Pluralibacter gergoviae]EKW9974132.1 c-type cytochrome biogenesis protein CcmI [Pluralibacter gergoviae]
MTTGFIVMAALLVLCIGLLFVPWSGRRSISRDGLNQLIYRQRLRELDENRDAIDASQREALVTDLQKNLLDDVPAAASARAGRAGAWVYLPGAVVLVAVTLGIFFKTSSLMAVSEWQQAAAQTPALLQRAMHPGAQPLTMSDLSRLALGLRTRLQQHPDNLESWVVLGRIGVVLNNYTLASQAFEKAYRMAPQNADVKAGYAEILLRSPDEADNRLADMLLQEMNAQAPNNTEVLGLMAFSAFERQRYPQAIDAWQKMLQALPAGDSRRAVIERSIAKAQQELDGAGK